MKKLPTVIFGGFGLLASAIAFAGSLPAVCNSTPGPWFSVVSNIGPSDGLPAPTPTSVGIEGIAGSVGGVGHSAFGDIGWTCQTFFSNNPSSDVVEFSYTPSPGASGAAGQTYVYTTPASAAFDLNCPYSPTNQQQGNIVTFVFGGSAQDLPPGFEAYKATIDPTSAPNTPSINVYVGCAKPNTIPVPA